jgi:hypothetical protein
LEIKDSRKGLREGSLLVLSPEMLKLPQATWIATFVEGVTDKSTGLPLFSELA